VSEESVERETGSGFGVLRSGKTGPFRPRWRPIQKIIVLAEERERLLHRKLQEPMLAERMKKDPLEIHLLQGAYGSI
jgi:hypothetical protein